MVNEIQVRMLCVTSREYPYVRAGWVIAFSSPVWNGTMMAGALATIMGPCGNLGDKEDDGQQASLGP